MVVDYDKLEIRTRFWDDTVSIMDWKFMDNLFGTGAPAYVQYDKIFPTENRQKYIFAFAVEHEFIHNYLADKSGMVSEVIWDNAHGISKTVFNEIEESLVFVMQAILNNCEEEFLAIHKAWVDRIGNRLSDFRSYRQELLGILRSNLRLETLKIEL